MLLANCCSTTRNRYAPFHEPDKRQSLSKHQTEPRFRSQAQRSIHEVVIGNPDAAAGFEYHRSSPRKPLGNSNLYFIAVADPCFSGNLRVEFKAARKSEVRSLGNDADSRLPDQKFFQAPTHWNIPAGIIASGNYVTGGHSNSGCGIIADDSANNAQFTCNVQVITGQCGISIADGTNQVVDGNKILDATPVAGGGNTAITVWKQYSSPCGPLQVSNNVASAVDTSGNPHSCWNGGGCDPVTLTNNVFDAAAAALLHPVSTNLPSPPIPPQPFACVVVSPYTNNTSLPSCGGSSGAPSPPTLLTVTVH